MDDPSLPVTKMVAPQWRGGRTYETITASPSPRDVEEALRHVDGQEFNDLYLITSDTETFLGVCGGAGRYMVTVCGHGEQVVGQLRNHQDPSDVRETIMCGGQRTNLPRHYLVDLPAALTAAVHYLATAEAAPALNWDWYR